ncbi:MAG: SDR family oxidoreductase [Acidobacteriota bacterium]
MTLENTQEIINSGEAARVGLIVGGVRGIGRALSTELAERGWTIIAGYRENEAAALSLETELSGKGARVSCVRADVSKPEEAESLVRGVESEFNRIDALVLCLGRYHRVSLMEESVDGWHEMFDHNLHPVFHLCRLAAGGMMQRRWGRIVGFSMVNADRLSAQPYVTAHYIAKIGILVLMRSFAKMLAPYGITANAISPGFIETGSVPKDLLAESMKSIPAGYMGSPKDAVGAACYLLSDEARYVNGSNIHVSGAWGM